ncbi:type IV pilus assembly protein PilM [Nitrospira defluvii]|nr:type IV pilus assembly protein PilM [Nitrospira defluvii]
MGFSFFPSPKRLTGLDIGSGAIKLVQLEKIGKGYRLQKFGVKPLDSELIVDGTIMDAGRVIEIIRTLVEEQEIKTTDVAFSVSGHSVIVKKIQLPTMSEDELEDSIKWEAEQYIPFDINDVNIDFSILETEDTEVIKDQMDVLLVAVKREKLSEYTSVVMEAGLQPVIVDVDAFTLENMFGINYEVNTGEVVALVDIGASVMNINIIKGGGFAFTRDISIGGNRYTETIQREFNVNFEQAEWIKKGEAVEGVNVDHDALLNIFDLLNEKIASEVLRSFDYFKTTAANEEIDRILISGGGSKVSNLIPHLTDKLNIPIEVVNPFRNIEIPDTRFDPTYIEEMAPIAAVGVGLALRELGDR